MPTRGACHGLVLGMCSALVATSAAAQQDGEIAEQLSSPHHDVDAVSVRGDEGLTLHRLASEIETGISGVTIDRWEPVCDVPCRLTIDRDVRDSYGVSIGGGSVVRADDQPILWLDEDLWLDVELVDRSDLRVAGIVVITVMSLIGLFVTLLPSFTHSDGVVTTLVGSGTVLAATVIGLSLIFLGDTARVEPAS